MSFDTLQQLSLSIRCFQFCRSERAAVELGLSRCSPATAKSSPIGRATQPRALRSPQKAPRRAPAPTKTPTPRPPAEEAAAAALRRNKMAAMASLRRFLSPAFYQAAATDFGAMVRTKYIQGNILAQPITGFMVTIGAVGYFIEYSVLGRYHVAHKKEKTAAAIKEYDAKHAHH